MNHHTENLIVGQGLAGTALAWRLHEAGRHAVVIDRGEPATASRVSAGLITPWTGRRMTQSSGYPEEWAEATDFYRRLEEQTGQTLFQQQSMLRIFVHRSDETMFEQRREQSGSSGLERWSGRLQAHSAPLEGCRMEPAGRLDVKQYLQASVDFFSQRQQWLEYDLRLPDGLRLTEQGVEVPDLDLSADRVIFCTGAASNGWFEGIPNNRSRGDVINVHLDHYEPREVVHHSIWLAPEADGSVTVGSTYDWKYLKNEPTAAGRREILKALQRFIDGPIRVNHHTAAVRPTMKDYQPVIGCHPEYSQLMIFTGLGSRGVLTAPRYARLLTETLTGTTNQLPEEVSPARLQSTAARRSLTQLAQDRVAAIVQAGDVVVDATVGNGFDTVFLAERVSPTGTVYGFDVQAAAIQATQKRLEAAGLRNVELLSTSHAEYRQNVDRAVTAAMFNLGYLPRSDHRIVTQAETTIAALQQIHERLLPGGIITVLAYRGHEGGPEEAAAVEKWLQQCPGCTLERVDSLPPRDSSPVLFVLQKSG